MGFKTNGEYDAFKKKVFNFLWKEVEPLADKIENTRELPREELFPKFREYGLWGLATPEKYGGVGLTISQYLSILAEISKVSGATRILIHVHNTSARAIAQYGTDKQKERYLPKVAVGESSVAFTITEANAGTGMDLASTAVKKGDYYILSGEKHLITNSAFTDLFMTCCWTDKTRGRKGLSALMVERGAPGFTLKPMPDHMGCNGIWHGILTFKNVKVPLENIIGKEGDGLEIFLGELEPSRVFVAASSLGTAERALEIALDYSQKRLTFGKPIAERETIRALLANMAMDVYALRLMLTDVGKKMDKGEFCPVEASITKLFGLEAVMRVTDRAMEVLGGRAYVQRYPYPFERIYREARINALEEGTPSIQRLVVARSLLKEDAPLKIGTL